MKFPQAVQEERAKKGFADKTGPVVSHCFRIGKPAACQRQPDACQLRPAAKMPPDRVRAGQGGSQQHGAKGLAARRRGIQTPNGLGSAGGENRFDARGVQDARRRLPIFPVVNHQHT